MKRWLADVTYYSEELGDLDVTYAIDELPELNLLIENGPGVECVVSIVMRRPDVMPVNNTIEGLLRQLQVRESDGV